jgi:RNA-directed DNA polymerase
MSGGNVRQELYDRIRESSKDEVILEEMIQLGFWPRGEGQPSVHEDLIKRQGEINRELNEAASKQAIWSDPQRALKEMHKQRKRAAMERRKETKLRNAQKRQTRALAWAERRKTDLLYLGPDVSGGLSRGADAGIRHPGTPELASPNALAAGMGITMPELRFLAYDRALSRVSHYQRFLIPKKAGGDRLISAPMPRLKRAQYWVLDNILAVFPVHQAAHGFAPDRSIVSNALPHVGREVVVNLDLKDFFPTLTWKRVKGKFRGLGYSEAVATVLALLCTEPDVDAVELDGERLYARKGPRRLPQGAPTSPALTNLICYRLDRRIAGVAAKLGFTYTRYADDMTFSASGEAAARVGTLLKAVNTIVEAEGFTVHPDKTRVMRRHRRQEVTGLTVNDRVAVPRDVLRRFRALLHQIEVSGPEGKKWGSGGNVLTAAVGFAQFVRMVDAEVGAPLVARTKELARRHGVALPAPVETDFRALGAKGQPPLARWWQPNEKRPPAPEPVLAAHIAAQAPPQPAPAAPPAAPRQAPSPAPSPAPAPGPAPAPAPVPRPAPAAPSQKPAAAAPAPKPAAAPVAPAPAAPPAPAPRPAPVTRITARASAAGPIPAGPAAPAAAQSGKSASPFTSSAGVDTVERPASPTAPAPMSEAERQAAVQRIQLPPQPRATTTKPKPRPKPKPAKKGASSWKLVVAMTILGVVLGVLRVPYPIIAAVVLLILFTVLVYGLIRDRG